MRDRGATDRRNRADHDLPAAVDEGLNVQPARRARRLGWRGRATG